MATDRFRIDSKMLFCIENNSIHTFRFRALIHSKLLEQMIHFGWIETEKFPINFANVWFLFNIFPISDRILFDRLNAYIPVHSVILSWCFASGIRDHCSINVYRLHDINKKQSKRMNEQVRFIKSIVNRLQSTTFYIQSKYAVAYWLSPKISDKTSAYTVNTHIHFQFDFVRTCWIDRIFFYFFLLFTPLFRCWSGWFSISLMIAQIVVLCVRSAAIVHTKIAVHLF